MKFAKLEEILSDFPKDPVISIAGAGGKTTLMFRLARQISGPCVVTTTTKVGENQAKKADICMKLNEFPPNKSEKCMWVSTDLTPVQSKILGCGPQEFSLLSALCLKRHFPLINEADGAARRHIKAPADHEPVIPPESNVCVYVTGLDVIGLPLDDENVHRPEIFSELTGQKIGTALTVQSVIKLLEHPYGGLKNIPGDALKIVYLTHVDTDERLNAARHITDELEKYDLVCY